MNWKSEMDELRRREEFAEQLGGAERVKRQHDGGPLHDPRADRPARRRGQLPRDRARSPGKASYDGKNDLEELTPSNFVFGRARLDGRPVVVGGDDFTVRGGSADATIKGKHNQCEQMANELRLPLIRLVEGSGGGGSVKTIETTGRANVPGVVGLGVGRQQHRHRAAGGPRPGLGGRPGRRAPRRRAPLGDGEGEVGALRRRPAGGGAARAEAHQEPAGRLADPAQGGRGGPRGRHRGGGVRGGTPLPLLPAVVHPRSAPARARAPTIRSAARSGSATRSRATSASPTRCARSSRRWWIATRSSRSSRSTGAPIITGLARLDGWPVAVLASDPYFYGGAWTADTCQKVERFVDLAQTFHLPVVYLVDCPGFLIGLEAEQTGTIKQGVRAMSAIWQSTIPWCAVIIRNVFGVAGAAPQAGGAVRPALRVAFRALGVAAARGWHRGRVPGRHRCGRRSGGQDGRDRGAAAEAPLPVPLRGDLLDRGDHRPARDAAAAV